MIATDPRAYPARPFLAVSAAIYREGRILLVRRARAPGRDLFSLPGGVVGFECLAVERRNDRLRRAGQRVGRNIGEKGSREVELERREDIHVIPFDQISSAPD